jgi:hypothetical protein
MTGCVEERSGAFVQLNRRDTKDVFPYVTRPEDERVGQTAADEIWKVRKIETTLTSVRPPASSSVRMGEY